MTRAQAHRLLHHAASSMRNDGRTLAAKQLQDLAAQLRLLPPGTWKA